jgi:putative Mg2+ transporter-C (MgtC) family protein
MDVWSFALNMSTALVLGMVIGLERQFRQHPAGLRTNTLVCLGAALFVSLSFAAGVVGDATRVAGQVVSGIGFLGGGVILREGLNVRGMTTAATLWCSAAIGVLAGAGMPAQAALGTAAILFAHLALRPVVKWVDARMKMAGDIETYYRIRAVCQCRDAAVIRTIVLRHINAHHAMTVQSLALQETGQPDSTAVVAEVFSHERNDRHLDDTVARLSIEPSVTAVSWERVR